MRQKIDTMEARKIYAGRSAIVEPVFGNIRFNKKLDHFTYRGVKKVSVQWRLYCLVHNIEKIAHFGKKYGPKPLPPPLSSLVRALPALLGTLHRLANVFCGKNLRPNLTFLTFTHPVPGQV